MIDWIPAPGELAVFTGATFVLNATPGADLLLTAERTLRRGFASGLAASAGVSAGCIVHALAAASGLAALLALLPAAFTAIQWAGAAYLAWLGVQLIRRAWGRADEGGASATPVSASRWADFRTGALTNLLNPKVAFFFLAFLPQFVPQHSSHVSASFLFLGAWFVVQSQLFLAAFAGIVALAARRGGWQTRTTLKRLLGTLAGLLFFGLALRLLGARLAPA